jgi:hypothetical protein
MKTSPNEVSVNAAFVSHATFRVRTNVCSSMFGQYAALKIVLRLSLPVTACADI